jgi:hypothetical protein
VTCYGSTYQWLLVPEQPTARAPVEGHPLRLSGTEPLAVRASKKLRNDELLITKLAEPPLQSHDIRPRKRTIILIGVVQNRTTPGPLLTNL